MDVAYETALGACEGCAKPETYVYIVVKDLRTGHVLHRVPDGIPLEATPENVGVGRTEKIVLKGDGAVAWIARDDLRSERLGHSTPTHIVKYYDLYALDSMGERLLASGIELDPSSLALAGSTLYWTEGGKPFSALLH